MVHTVKTLLTPGRLDENLLNSALAGLYEEMDLEEDPSVVLTRLREIAASRWFLQSQLLKQEGKEWETVFSYPEWTREQFNRTIMDQWETGESTNWYDLGQAAGRMGLWSLAAHFYRHAFTTNSHNNPSVELNLARALLQIGQREEADSYLSKIQLTENTEQAKANWLLAQSLVAQARYSEAASAFQSVIAAAPVLISTQEGAEVAKQIEAHGPIDVPDDLRFIWTKQASNEVVNGGFEEGYSAWGMWPVLGANSTIDDGRAFSGMQSFRVQFDGSRDVDYYQVGQRIPIKSGRKYQLSAKIWSEFLTGQVGLEVSGRDWHGGVTNPVISGSTQGWQTTTHSFTVPAGLDEITITIRRYGGNGLVSGTAWVDDIVLQQIQD